MPSLHVRDNSLFRFSPASLRKHICLESGFLPSWRVMMHRTFWTLALAFAACETSTPDSGPPTQPPGPGEPEPTCTFASPLTAAELPDFATSLACESDVLALASAPLDASIPGARSLKVIYDRTDQRLYLQNAERFPTHYSFASTHLSGQGKPVVPPVAQFNQTEYYSPYRRFVLGTLSYYQGPAIWAFELAPYDNASNELLTEAFFALKSAFSFELGVRYHPSSQAQDQQSRTLDPTIPLFRPKSSSATPLISRLILLPQRGVCVLCACKTWIKTLRIYATF